MGELEEIVLTPRREGSAKRIRNGRHQMRQMLIGFHSKMPKWRKELRGYRMSKRRGK